MSEGEGAESVGRRPAGREDRQTDRKLCWAREVGVDVTLELNEHF